MKDFGPSLYLYAGLTKNLPISFSVKILEFLKKYLSIATVFSKFSISPICLALYSEYLYKYISTLSFLSTCDECK